MKVLCIKTSAMSNTVNGQTYNAIGKWTCGCSGSKPEAFILEDAQVKTWTWIKCRACGNKQNFPYPTRSVNAERFTPVDEDGVDTMIEEANKLYSPTELKGIDKPVVQKEKEKELVTIPKGEKFVKVVKVVKVNGVEFDFSDEASMCNSLLKLNGEPPADIQELLKKHVGVKYDAKKKKFFK